jgi:hypothetical protein
MPAQQYHLDAAKHRAGTASVHDSLHTAIGFDCNFDIEMPLDSSHRTKYYSRRHPMSPITNHTGATIRASWQSRILAH